MNAWNERPWRRSFRFWRTVPTRPAWPRRRVRRIDETRAALFTDPLDPTDAQLRAWAYAPDAEALCQDFDLMLANTGRDALFVEFAADGACPTREWCLSVLYLMVGDAVRTGLATLSESGVRTLLARADGIDSVPLRRWQERSLRLMRDPASFDYDDWCAGALARRA